MKTQVEKVPHFSLIRSFRLADWFTISNAFCGMGSVLAIMSYLQSGNISQLYLALGLVPVALVFDIFDGRVARSTGSPSTLGRELDSLADVISFGVAPAAAAYAVGMQGFWDCLVLIYFVACGVSRLARYNVTAESLAMGGDKVKYYEGTPIPTSVLLIGLLAFAASQDRIGQALYWGSLQLGPWQIHPLVLFYLVSGSLMISKTLRIPKL